MTRNLFWSLAVTLLVMVPPAAWGQSQEAFAYYRDIMSKISKNYVNAVRPHLGAKEKSILNKINFRLGRNQNIYANAVILPSGERVVEVSFGFLVFMENLTLAYAVTGAAGRSSCFYAYLQFAAEVALQNTKAAIDGGRMAPIKFFYQYAKSNGRGCEGFSEIELRNSDALAYVAGGMDALMTFLMGHEVAHHLLGHLDFANRGAAARNLALSRQMETEADIWAMDHAFAIGVNPSPGLPMWAFFAAIGGSDIRSELESTHPLGIRRWADSLKSILDRMRTPQYRAKFGVVDDSALASLQRQHDALRALVP